MDVHRDRRIGALGAVDIDSFELARSVGKTQRLAEHGARVGAVDVTAMGHLLAVGRVDDLIVRVIELLLVHVEPDQRAFDAARRGFRLCAGRQGLGHRPPPLILLVGGDTASAAGSPYAESFIMSSAARPISAYGWPMVSPTS